MVNHGTGRRGSVGQEQNGSWSFVVDITAAGELRQQTRRRGYRTQKAAQAALTRTLNELAEHAYVAPTRQTLASFLVDDWLPAIEKTVRPSTFDSYRRNVRLHVVPHPAGAAAFQSIDAPRLNKLYSELLTGGDRGRPLSARSVQYVHVILHRAFRDAVRWDRLVRNPCDSADPPRPSNKHRATLRTWTAQELSVFLASSSDDRLAAAWWLLAMTGMRRGEALGLGWDAVDLEQSTLSIRRTLVTTEARRAGQPGMAWSEPKTDKGWRLIALDADTVAVLRAHRARQVEERLLLGRDYTDDGLVFAQPTGAPIHPKTMSYYFQRAAARSGLPRIRLHDLRHSHATLALKAGVHPRVVQERLGHANVGVTLDTYSHVTMPMQAEAAQLIASLVNAASSRSRSPQEPTG